MTRKRRIRELAMQILFLWDSHGQRDADMAGQLVRDTTQDAELARQANELAEAAWEQREVADRWVERLAPQWPPQRQPAVDRNLLRMAVYEMINTTTPPKIVIDEAIEMAKHFSTELSASFINGVLDSVLKEHQQLTGTEAVRHEGTNE
jgi:transcription antitermination protein NusB